VIENAPRLKGIVKYGVGIDAIDIVAARRRGIPVVLSTRVYTGRVVPLYARDVETQQIGCILADNLSAQKARVLLMLAE